MSDVRAQDEALASLGEAARAVWAEEEESPDEHGRQWRALAQARARRPRAVFLPVAGALAAALALLFVVRAPRPPVLTFTVDGKKAPSEGYVFAAGDSAVRFTDGTEVGLVESSRLRVLAVTADGARLALEDGRANVQVIPRARARWTIDAGPFSVAVTGTRFDLAFDAQAGRLALSLHEGSVVVSAPFLGAPVVVRTGQRLTADAATRAVTLGTAGRPAPHVSPQGSEATQAARPAATSANVPRASSTRLEAPAKVQRASARLEAPAKAPRASTRPEAPAKVQRPSTPLEAPAPEEARPPAPSWPALVARGAFADVLVAARAGGVERCLSACGVADLEALADAARFGGAPGTARQALHATRARFGRADAARTAAFLLGRLAEDEAGALAEALGWYERYLGEAPQGRFASEALGRKMLVLSAQRETTKAAATARLYVHRFPQGPYAHAARKLIEDP